MIVLLIIIDTAIFLGFVIYKISKNKDYTEFYCDDEENENLNR